MSRLSMDDTLGVKAGKALGDGIKLEAFMNLLAVLKDKDGKVIDEQKVSNQVQTAMLTHVADALSAQAETQASHMGIGSGTGQGVGDNALATQLTRQALDNATPSHSAAVVTYHRTFAAGEGTGTVTEAGVFNDVAAGTMLLYNDSISFAKGAGDSLELTWTLTIS